jgi:hypothetical protein
VVNVTKHGCELQVASCELRVAGCGFIRLLIALMIHIVEIASPPFVVFLGYWLFAHRLFAKRCQSRGGCISRSWEPVPTDCSSSATIWPSNKCTVRWAYWANLLSWVTMQMVAPP